MKRSILLALAALAACQAHGHAAAPPATRVPADEGFLATYTATSSFRDGLPTGFALAPDGSAVYFLRTGPRSADRVLYRLDPKTGKEQTLATAADLLAGAAENMTAEEKQRRERLRLSAHGITSFELSEDGAQILIPLGGRLFLVDTADGKHREIETHGPAADDARLSPDGRSVAVVRDGDLWLNDLHGGHEHRLTTRSGKEVTNGLAEFVAQEEMDRFEGFWWSPTSSQIAYEEADVSGVEHIALSDSSQVGAAVRSVAYPRPGNANARVRLGVMPAAGGRTTWVSWDDSTYPYLATVRWSEHAPLTLVVENRTQTELAILTADPATGKTRQLHVERDAAWLNLDPQMPSWLPDGSGFLWTTEHNGDRQLELHDHDGALARTITPLAMGYRDLLDVDPQGAHAVVRASTDPTRVQVIRIPLLPGTDKPEPLSPADGLHGGIFSHDHGTWVFSAESLSSGPTFEVRNAAGKTLAPIASEQERPPFEPRVELMELGGPAHLRAAVVRPRTMQPGARYPVIDDVYGGPHVQRVVTSRQRWLLDQYWADQGFIVVSIDGRGTPGRGREWERAIKDDLASLALEDQAAGLAELGRRFPELDLTRTGIAGWSFGGYLSAMATIRRPDVFAAGIAGAPVTDWRNYDTFYTERYLGLPDHGSYEKSSVLTYASQLKRPLLIVHGTSDDNVVFQHSLLLADALFRAGKDFELLPLSGLTHMVSSPQVTERLQERILSFFTAHLGGPRGPGE